MTQETQTKCIGILTSGGDCPGLNPAIRAVTKSALHYGMTVIGIMDGFRGLVQNRTMLLESKHVSGILTHGGTILGSSRDKPHKMPMGGKVLDMTEVAVGKRQTPPHRLSGLPGRWRHLEKCVSPPQKRRHQCHESAQDH